ncbi:DUF3592 domain-containing protein [Streptomyces sp. NPDC019396]|uniref:DUF3592 domain-containing protein n=1 Tax=Streptomyces sp. NPDC019396 TaxID=3154687 RepID=UPI0033D7DBC9
MKRSGPRSVSSRASSPLVRGRGPVVSEGCGVFAASGALGGGYGMVLVVIGSSSPLGGVRALVSMVRKGGENRRILREGLLAEAVCLETYMVHRTVDGYGSSERRLILGFQTSDGRDVRAEMASVVLCAVGDRVPVRYLPERPEQVIHAGSRPGLDPNARLKGTMMVVFICLGLYSVVTGIGLGMR